MKRSYLFLLALVALFVTQAVPGFAQTKKVDIDTKDLPKLLGASNAGTEFLMSFPPCYSDGATASDYCGIYIASGTETKVSVTIGGATKTLTTVANDVVAIRLTPAEAQPFVKATGAESPKQEVWSQAAIRIKAEDPIVVYGVSRFQYTTDGFLALPTSALGKEYVLSSMADMSAMYSGLRLPSITCITAAYDNTNVIFKMGGTTISETRGRSLKPGQSSVYTLAKKGDVLCISTTGNESDLSGSYVQATKPVAVITGNQCANVPTHFRWCDFVDEMEIPMYTWGSEYHVTPFARRLTNPFVKVFAKFPNTEILVDGISQGIIRNAPGGVQGQGHLYFRIGEGGAPRPYVVSGRLPDGQGGYKPAPIYVVSYNTGQEDDNIPSDPFQLTHTPIEQFQKEIVWATPGAKGAVGFRDNYVNIVYALTPDGNIPDDLEFAQVVNGKMAWNKLKTVFGSNIGQRFQVKVNNKDYAVKTVKLPKDGVYRLRAGDKFCAYAYGGSDYDSYGFPTSVALGDLRDTVDPVPTWTVNCADGSVKDGRINDMPENTEERSNMAEIRLINSQSNNYELRFDDFVAGEARLVRWYLNVLDTKKPAKATVYFVDRAGNDTTIVITYQPFLVDVTPSPIDFGIVKRYTPTVTKTVKVRNPNANPLHIVDFKIKGGASSKFSIVNKPTVPMDLLAGAEVDVTVELNTADKGVYTDQLLVAGECAEPPVDIKAEVAVPVIQVSDINFGTRGVNDAVNQPTIVRNTGKVDLVVSGYVAATQNPPFKSENTNDPQYKAWTFSTPVVIKPGQEFALKYLVNFNSPVIGSFNDQIVFNSDTDPEGADSIAVLTAVATQGSLRARGFDWERRRTRPSTPYTGTFVIWNTGNKDVTLKTATVRRGSDATFSLANPAGSKSWTSSVANVTIKGGTDETSGHVVNVLFDPQDPGDNSVEIQAVDIDGNPVSFELKGTGIEPRVAITPTVDFGSMNTSSDANPATVTTRTVTISNEQYAFSDTLLVTDLVFDNATMVGKTVATPWPAAASFQYEHSTVIPAGGVKIAPGASVPFTVSFVARRDDANTVTATTVSDSRAQASSVWNGVGIPTGLAATPDNPLYCVGETGVITVTLSNNSVSGDVSVTGLSLSGFNPAEATFTLLDNAPFTIGAGSSVPVRIQVTALVAKASHTATLTVDNSTATSQKLVPVAFRSQALARQTSMPNQSVTIGSTFNYPVVINAGDELASAGVREFQVVVNIGAKNDNFLLPERAQGQNGFTVTSWQKTSPGVYTFTVTTAAPAGGTGTIEVARIPFRVVLPSYGLENGQTKYRVDVTHQITAQGGGAQCVTLTPGPSIVEIDPVCANNLRGVTVSLSSFLLNEVNPNPVSGDEVEIGFSVGFRVQTDVVLYDAMGQTIARLVSQELEPGSYAVRVPVGSLTSGTYTYRMISGPYTQTQRLVIAK